MSGGHIRHDYNDRLFPIGNQSDIVVFNDESNRLKRPQQHFLRSDSDDRGISRHQDGLPTHQYALPRELDCINTDNSKRKRHDEDQDNNRPQYEQYHRHEQRPTSREARDVQLWFGSASHSAANDQVSQTTPPSPSLLTRLPPPPTPPTTVSASDRQHELTIAKLLLRSREFLRATRFVRNTRGEIDWVATFLRVGFARHSLYALMCPRRKGRWKAEEERYALELLRLLGNGTLRLRAGQSVRAFVSRKLHSDDMRVLKKLSNCKRFHFARSLRPTLRPGGVNGGEVDDSDEDEQDDDEDPDVEKAESRVPGAGAALDRLAELKREFLRAVQLEALVAVRKYLSDDTLRELLAAQPRDEQDV
jgi:hypothetical protein